MGSLSKRLVVCFFILTISAFFDFSLHQAYASNTIGSTTITIYAIADTYVNSSSADTNYGNESLLQVSSNSKYDYAYIMFDLSTLPSDANIFSVQLQVYMVSKGGQIYGMPSDDIGAYFCPDNSWSEMDITWNNKPDFIPSPTDTWSFSIIFYLKEYKSWDITEDVKNAVPVGKLTEVLKFHSKTDYGYATFQSREQTNKPKLVVEYSMKPAFKVSLESSQDTGATSNIGFTTFANNRFILPKEVDVVEGAYSAVYTDGYMFLKWETSGGVTVSNETSPTTDVTVSGAGTLRAVGNTKQLEHCYDHHHPVMTEGENAGYVDAVRFTPLCSGQLFKARFYLWDYYPYEPNAFKVRVMDENRQDMISAFTCTPPEAPYHDWLDVDLSTFGIWFDEGMDFYVGMEWITDSSPDLAVDYTQASFGRSWQWNGTTWKTITHEDFMIRAVIGTVIEHNITVDSAILQVKTESNSTISILEFIKNEKKLAFNVNGANGTRGFCNVSIPNPLLGEPFNVTVDGQLLDEVFSFNDGACTWLYFSYDHSGHRVEIIATTVIPEYEALFLVLLLLFAFVAVAFGKKIGLKR